MAILDVVTLALFDLDDTLVDRQHAFRQWASHLLETCDVGGDALARVTQWDGDGFTPRHELFEQMSRELPLSLSPEELAQRYESSYYSYFVVEESTFPALRQLRSLGWKVGIVTNGPPSQMKKIRAARLDEEVDACCVSGLVDAWKPDPRIFEAAARACGVPLEGWMVGDSPTADIAGGQGVGLRTIWFDHGRQWDDASPAPTARASSIAEAVAIMVA